MIEILQRYHVDEGRETENTCPSNGEIPPHKSSTNPLGTKQCSCFCKYEDSMGNICYPYEMVMYEDEVEVCQPSLDLHNLEGTRPQNRVGEARHYLNNSFLPLTGNSEFPGGELDDYTIGRHYLPNFATAGYNYGSELPEITECNITLDGMEECTTLPCTDNGPIIQQAIDDFSGTLLPDDPDDFYEDCLMAAYFFGGKVLVENNKSGFLNYFDRRGYSSWLIRPKGGRKTQRGIAAGVASKEQLASAFASYIDKNTDRIVFPRLLNDLLDFDIQNSTKNDATMAAGWAIVAAYRLKRSKKMTQNQDVESSNKDYNFDFSDISMI